MAEKKKLKKFMVQAKLDLQVGIKVIAKDLDEALIKSKEMKEEDFVKINGEYMDGNMSIIGMYEF